MPATPATSAAQGVIASARSRIPGGPQQPRPALSEAERKEAREVIQAGGACGFCAGLHAGDERACPRLASFELDGDNRVRAGTFWAEWDCSRVVFADEAAEGDD